MTSSDIPSLAGIFPPVPTTFQENGDVAFDRLQANLDKLNQEPLQGYVMLGSNGEFPFLTVEEKVNVIRAAREVIPSERLLIAGAGAESTRECIALTEEFTAEGADLVIVVTPSYYKAKMNGAALEQHYRQIGDAAPVPVMLYNVPPNTQLDIPVETVAKLAAHPNIIGMKETNANIARLGALARALPADFQLLCGSASFLLAALSVGAVGGVNGLANVAPGLLARLYEAFHQGEMDTARALQHRAIPPNAAVTTRFGVPGLKAALDMLGYYGGPVRSPLLPLGDADRAILREILVEAGILNT